MAKFVNTELESAGSFFSAGVTGDKELAKLLSQLPVTIQKRVLRNALRKSMTHVSKAIKKNLQEEIRFVKDGDQITSHNDNAEARAAKLKVIKKSIQTKIRTSRKYTSRGNVVAVTGKRYGDKFPADPDINPDLWGKNINPFARKYEFKVEPYIRPALHSEKEKVFSTARAEIRKGIPREVKRLKGRG